MENQNSLIQHLLNHAPFIYSKLANFNKCWITMWIFLMKSLWDVCHEKLINLLGRYGILNIFMDVSHILEMIICTVNQLKTISIVRDCSTTFPVMSCLNIASGSEANISTSCEMEIFNFLWLIWDHYLTLAPTKNNRPPWPPGWGLNLGAPFKTKLALQIAILIKI